ncbi:MAG TPA: hypothetical protein VNK03_03910 [Gammaproteobacteria bacterium]|nr:hypothetical protein [Gammaproteobacteria bacterium]
MNKLVFSVLNKSILGSMLIALCSLYVTPVQASVTPFGLEVGKTTINELKKKWTFTELEKNRYYGWNHRITDPQQLKEVKAVEALFVVDEKGILQAIALWKDKALFEQELGVFTKQYQTVKTHTPVVGDKYAEFRDNHSNILILELLYKLDTQLFVIYQTPLFHKKYEEYKEKNQTKS